VTRISENRFAVLISAVLVSTSSVLAEDLATPKDKVILTISGAIEHTNEPGLAQFDHAMLSQMKAVTFQTSTIWTDGPQVFTGVALVDLLDDLGAEGTGLHVIAANDYTIEIPMSDVVEGGPILAYARNGSQMTLRDKGPLWIVYPYDLNPAYQSETIYARSVWQVDRIEVVR
jgi:hypothetical protein